MFQLKANPFEHQATYDFDDYRSQPFILEGLEAIKQLKNKITWNLESKERVLIKILALKGFGKSTTSFYLQEIINSREDPNLLTFFTNQIDTSYFRILHQLNSEFKISNIIYTSMEKDIVFLEKDLKKFLEGKKLYIFIDFQDILSTNSFKTLAETLEKLPLLSKSISIILSMNKAHAIKMENISYVLGKYTSFELPPFSLDATKKLISERLMKYREDGLQESIFYPFNDNILGIIYNHTGGVPRNILSACDLILNSASEDEQINEEEVPILLKREFSKKVIYDMVEEEGERTLLTNLYDTIKNDFNGEVSKEKDLHEKLNLNFGWSNKTARRRIRQLHKFGLINITKGENQWANVIRII